MNAPTWTDNYGTLYYLLDGDLHREDGPAIIRQDGGIGYYIKGKAHRADGPAIEYADGRKEWYVNGLRLNCSCQEEFKRFIKLKAFW